MVSQPIPQIIVGDSGDCYQPETQPLFANKNSTIYRGIRESDGETVAIKFLPRQPDEAAGWQQVEQLRKVMEEIGEHPRIIPILDIGITGDFDPFIVMPFVKG